MTDWNTKIDEGPLFRPAKVLRLTHKHSATALDAQAVAGTLSKRCKSILGALRASQQPMTDREIKDYLQFDDMNSVRPRITEMIRDRVLEECGSVTCPVTHLPVRLVKERE